MLRIFLMILTLMIPAISFSVELNSMFWNIGNGRYSNTDSDGVPHILGSLEELANSNFDIIALSEYNEIHLRKKPEFNTALEELSKNFPFKEFIPYSEGGNSGVVIYSKSEFNLKVGELDWVRSHWSIKRKKRYKKRISKKFGNTGHYTRSYLRARVIKSGKEFNIVFYHLHSPWNAIEKKIGKLRTALKSIFGRFHSVANQISQIKNRLVDDFGRNYRNENIAILGDSNCAYKMFGIKTGCYKLLERILPPVYDSGKSFTWPDENSTDANISQKVRIDHINVSKRFQDREAYIPSLKGSDHKPIAIRLNL